MYSFLKLNKEVSEHTSDIEPIDVLSVKNRLKDLGYYKEPEWGMTNFTDNQMFDGIRNFQENEGLKVDGVMKPDGETENKINEVIEKKNGQQDNPSAQTDPNKEIRDQMYSVIKEHEHSVEFPYKDHKGYITVGLGSNVDNPEKFNSIEWKDKNGQSVSKEDIDRYYQELKNMQNGNFKATMYKNKTPLRIPENEIRRLYEEHLNEDLDYLRKTFKDFDKFPAEMQNVLIDIKYNTGNVEADRWPELHKAISERDLENIQKQVHRKDVGKERNQWAIETLRKIKKLDY